VIEAVEKLRCLAGAALEFADFIEEIYWPTPAAEKEPERDMVEIIAECARACGFTYGQVTARDRHEELHAVRQLIYMRLRAEECSYSRIGRLFGRNHSTIICAIQEAESLISINDPLIMRYKGRMSNV
jgi:chromosomal replication initiation ATPase DnaA